MSLNEKLLEIQQNPPELLKSATNPHFGNSYVPLDAVLEAVLPVLGEKGILLTQTLAANGPDPALRTTFTDVESGETLTDICPLVLDKTSPQAVGSAITYYRRYSIISSLGFNVDEDDDAEGATSHASRTSSGRSGRKKDTPSF